MRQLGKEINQSRTVPEQPKAVCNIVMGCYGQLCQRLPTGEAVTNCGPRREVGYLLHTTSRFQCCDIFGRETGRGLEGCETQSAFDKNGKFETGVEMFQEVRMAFYNRGLTRACSKH